MTSAVCLGFSVGAFLACHSIPCGGLETSVLLEQDAPRAPWARETSASRLAQFVVNMWIFPFSSGQYWAKDMVYGLLLNYC